MRIFIFPLAGAAGSGWFPDRSQDIACPAVSCIMRLQTVYATTAAPTALRRYSVSWMRQKRQGAESSTVLRDGICSRGKSGSARIRSCAAQACTSPKIWRAAIASERRFSVSPRLRLRCAGTEVRSVRQNSYIRSRTPFDRNVFATCGRRLRCRGIISRCSISILSMPIAESELKTVRISFANA